MYQLREVRCFQTQADTQAFHAGLTGPLSSWLLLLLTYGWDSRHQDIGTVLPFWMHLDPKKDAITVSPNCHPQGLSFLDPCCSCLPTSSWLHVDLSPSCFALCPQGSPVPFPRGTCQELSWECGAKPPQGAARPRSACSYWKYTFRGCWRKGTPLRVPLS